MNITEDIEQTDGTWRGNNVLQLRRISIRHECIEQVVKINSIEYKVLEMSLDGCSVESQVADSSKVFDGAIDLDFKRPSGKFKEIKIRSICQKISKNRENKYIYHFKFCNSQRPEKLGWLNRNLSRPLSCKDSNHERFERQKTLAENDINVLQSTIQGLKDRQFHLVMLSIPILFGLVSSYVGVIVSEAGSDINILYQIIPPAAIVLSVFFLLVYTQKIESIRRATAFTLILQRHLAMGALPQCYRGWYDAFENYNHIAKYGAEPNSPLHESRIPKNNGKAYISAGPANMFNILSVGMLCGIILASVFLMSFVAFTETEGHRFGLLNYTGVIIFICVFFMAIFLFFAKKYYDLTQGKRSFSYLVCMFSLILKWAPPFDPLNNSKIGTHLIPDSQR